MSYEKCIKVYFSMCARPPLTKEYVLIAIYTHRGYTDHRLHHRNNFHSKYEITLFRYERLMYSYIPNMCSIAGS